ncbi:MAG: type II secretion system protein [Leptolyngbyaceae cyanobacterium CRU_2_3]|nr:type II secretion system protein [Leptolyngbyaceae cyanobacterium CRU_2_3]
MAKHDFLNQLKSRLKRSLLPKQPSNNRGFTLLELLIVVGIAGGIIAGLMYIVVELLGTDQREASRSETQREMQMAMDYISTELREAVYVYTGESLQCAGLPTGCQPLSTYLPDSVGTNSIPIIAFWKQEPFPNDVPAGSDRARCFTANPPAGISCLAGSSYALVVYSLSKANSGIWSNNARITRYALTEFNSEGMLNQGYVNPGSFDNFAIWPFGKATAGSPTTNLQSAALASGRQVGRPGTTRSVTPAVLVDFVDGGVGGVRQAPSCPVPGITDPNVVDSYSLSPPGTLLNSTPGFAGVRGFFACVSRRTTTVNGVTTEVDTGLNQDVILYVRGNANGRPGVIGDVFLPSLETRVLSRGVRSKLPSSN